MSQPIAVVVSPKGEARFVYQEEVDLSALGTQVIRRASHVEPTSGLSKPALAWLWYGGDYRRECRVFFDAEAVRRCYPRAWWADLTPSGGPVLGPFHKRSEALQAEAAWLHKNKILPSTQTPSSECVS